VDELGVVSVPHLLRKLIDASLSQDTPLLQVRNVHIVLGESDQCRPAEDLMKYHAALHLTKLDSLNEFVLEQQLRLIHQKQEEVLNFNQASSCFNQSSSCFW
jgi:hypothetical protein